MKGGVDPIDPTPVVDAGCRVAQAPRGPGFGLDAASWGGGKSLGSPGSRLLG